MKLDEIQSVWDNDSKLDRTELGEESLRIPQLHSKYFKIFSVERLQLRKMQSDHKKLFRDKYEWYNGSLSQETMSQYNWQPNPLKILRTDISMYIEADDDVVTSNLKIDMQQEKVDFVEAIIKSLTTRGYQIKSAIDWHKFQNGA
jgi:hypothetical protein